jgi:hypothetical protein
VRKKIPNWLKKLRLSSNLCFLSAILAAPDAAQIELGEAEGLKKPSKIDKKSICQSWHSADGEMKEQTVVISES